MSGEYQAQKMYCFWVKLSIREKHVAVFAFPFASHPSSQLKLTRHLASAAPTVVFSFFNTAKSNRALFAELSCDNILPYDVSDGLPNNDVFVGSPLDAINLYLPGAEEELRRAVRVAEKDTGRNITCLVVHAFIWFAADMAEEMNIPWVAYWSAGTCFLAAHFYTDLIRQKTGPDDEITDLIPGLKVVLLGDLPSEVVFGDLQSPCAIMLHKMGRNLSRASAVPVNSFQELDPDLAKNLSSKLNNFVHIGPSNLKFFTLI
ncbi:kaempferol 3-O-beta-D-galactosyltransferase [Helianthus annuus]|nr:kaempferol 3-O-beta-D-galactosyltransferase [Helianthus annuus]